MSLPDHDRRPSLLRDYRLSAASSSTVGTLLPQYSADEEWDSESFSHFPSREESINLAPILGTSRPFPPRYSAIHPEHIVTPSPVESSDQANVQSYDFQYRYPIKTTSTKPWATLHLYVRDAVPGNLRPLQVQPKTPRIWGSERISGRLDLDLDNPLTIKQIKIIVKGKITASALDEGSYKFLSHEFNLWDASEGSSGPDRKKQINEKLTGRHKFPFSLPFPNEFDPSSEPTTPSHHAFRPSSLITPSSPTNPNSPRKSEEQQSSFLARPGRRWSGIQRSKKQTSLPPVQPACQPRPLTVASTMPQTFMEKGITATVNYQILVQFVHGRIKTDSKITTGICYIPALRPLPSSQKRRQAYEAGALIPGPMNDPDGWFDLPKVSVDGIFHSAHGSRQVKIDCQLYVAQPLSYTRGTVIPCFLTLSSNDSEALDSLSDPNTVDVKLIRRLRHIAISEDTQHPNISMIYHAYDPLAPLVPRADKNPLHKTVYHQVATSTWWVPPKDVLQNVHVRHVEGEIGLHHDLQPSCSCQDFQVEYFVQMFSLQSADFKPTQSVPSNESQKKRLTPAVIARLPVDITTLCRLDEPLPIPFTESSEFTMGQVSSNGDDEGLARQRPTFGFL